MSSILNAQRMDARFVSKFNPTAGYPQTTWSTESNGTDNPVVPAFLPCNNPDNLIDQATAQRVDTVFSLIVLPLLELFGITTNVINCVVFARQGLKDRINLCLFSLAVADLCFIVSMFVAKFYSFLGLFDKDLEQYWSNRYRGTMLSPMIAAMTVSNMMTLIISLERCICVVSPFKAKKFLKTRYMAILIVSLTVYIVGSYSLLNMRYVTVHVTDPVTNTSRWASRHSAFYMSNRVMIEIFYNYLMNLTIPSLSLVVMIVATSITVSRLKTSLAWRQESVNTKTALGDKRETAVTKMMTVICFIYIATITPSVTQAFFRALFTGYTPAGKYCNIFTIFQTLSYTCEVTNSSGNFIVYVTMGSRYRQTLRELTGRASRIKAESLTSSQRT